MVLRPIFLIALSGTLAAACGSEGEPIAGPSSIEASSTTATTVTVSTTAAVVDPDGAAATTFIEAWTEGDAEAMRGVGEGDAVDAALAFGNANGSADCTTQRNGQHQCVVRVATAKRMYLLVGEPGAREGRVWWVAEYVPGT